MAAHRYWRVLGHGGIGSFTGLAEIQMRETLGGPTVTTGGTASATLPIQSGSAAAVFDGNLTTQVQWSGNAQKWVAYDFGAGNEKDIIEFAIAPNKDVANRTWTRFTLQYSDNGTDWTDSWRVSYTPWVIGTLVVFSKPSVVTSSRYWRIAAITPDAVASCTECTMSEIEGGADQTTGGTPIADSVFLGSFAADRAFDNNTGTLWSGATATPAGEAWLGYDFGVGVTKEINEFTWQARVDNFGQNPTSGYVESSTDGINWVKRWEYSTTTEWTALSIQTFTNPEIVTSPAPPIRRAVWLYY